MAETSPTAQEIMAQIQAMPSEEREKVIAEILALFEKADYEAAMAAFENEKERRRQLDEQQRESQARQNTFGIPEWDND